MKRRTHKVGSKWKAYRKLAGHKTKSKVEVHKVGKNRYKIRRLTKTARKRRMPRGRAWHMDNKRRSQEPWEVAYRKRKRRRRR